MRNQQGTGACLCFGGFVKHPGPQLELPLSICALLQAHFAQPTMRNLPILSRRPPFRTSLQSFVKPNERDLAGLGNPLG